MIRGLLLHIQKVIQETLDLRDITPGRSRMDVRGLGALRPEQFLDITTVSPTLQQVRCKGVPQRVYRHAFVNVAFSVGWVKGFLDWPFMLAPSRFGARKEPSRGLILELLNITHICSLLKQIRCQGMAQAPVTHGQGWIEHVTGRLKSSFTAQLTSTTRTKSHYRGQEPKQRYAPEMPACGAARQAGFRRQSDHPISLRAGFQPAGPGGGSPRTLRSRKLWLSICGRAAALWQSLRQYHERLGYAPGVL